MQLLTVMVLFICSCKVCNCFTKKVHTFPDFQLTLRFLCKTNDSFNTIKSQQCHFKLVEAGGSFYSYFNFTIFKGTLSGHIEKSSPNAFCFCKGAKPPLMSTVDGEI